MRFARRERYQSPQFLGGFGAERLGDVQSSVCGLEAPTVGPAY